MGRPGYDDRDSSKVEALLKKHLTSVKAGQTITVNTTYAGQLEVVGPDKGCAKNKCHHCAVFFAGDSRRRARHFLPAELPKGFWDKGDSCGVVVCTAPPPGVVEELAALGCQEHKKALAFCRGQDTQGMGTLCMTKKEKPVSLGVQKLWHLSLLLGG